MVAAIFRGIAGTSPERPPSCGNKEQASGAGGRGSRDEGGGERRGGEGIARATGALAQSPVTADSLWAAAITHPRMVSTCTTSAYVDSYRGAAEGALRPAFAASFDAIPAHSEGSGSSAHRGGGGSGGGSNHSFPAVPYGVPGAEKMLLMYRSDKGMQQRLQKLLFSQSVSDVGISTGFVDHSWIAKLQAWGNV